MSIQLICTNGKVEFPKKFHSYSGLVQRIINESKDTDDGSDNEEEEEVSTEGIPVMIKATTEVINLMLCLLEMKNNKDPSNILPPEIPKKVTAPKFKIEETIGEDVVEFFKESGKDGVFAITKAADFLDVKLITHLCFTWIAHLLNTLNTKQKMEWLGLSGEAPTFEEIMEVDLENAHDKEGGAGKNK